LRILFHWPTKSRDAADLDTAALISALRGAGHDIRVVGSGLGLMNALHRVLPPHAGAWVDVTASGMAGRRLRRAWLGFSPELIFVRAAAFHGAAARLAKATRSSLYVTTADRLKPAYEDFEGRLHNRGKAAESITWRAADRVLVPSAALAEAVHADGVPREKISVLQPGFAVPPVVSRPAPVAGGAVRIGVLARDRAGDAATAVVAGLASARGAARAELVVLPDDADVAAWAGVDIALYPDGGGFALTPALLAAMAAGCAIVAADAALPREALTHTQTALLFDVQEPLYAWNATRWLLDEPKLRVLLGRAARHAVEQRARGWDDVAAEVVRLAAADIAFRRRFAASRLA